MKLRFFYVDGGIHPMLGQVLYWNPEVMDKEDKEAERYQRYICGVLDAIAQSVDNCDLLLSYINDIECERQVEIETGGNDVTLTLKSSLVQVDININEDWIGQSDGQFKLSEWKAALTGWRRFLEMPESFESVVEVDLTT